MWPSTAENAANPPTDTQLFIYGDMGAAFPFKTPQEQVWALSVPVSVLFSVWPVLFVQLLIFLSLLLSCLC
jgi:hypothetical protein